MAFPGSAGVCCERLIDCCRVKTFPCWASSMSSASLAQLKHGQRVKLLDTRHCNARFKLSASAFQSQESVERNDAAISGPLVGPHPALTAEDAVKVQLNALSTNDKPRRDHGVEVMYNFANAEGTLEGGTLSCYFGFPADLYHYGHFSLKFKSRFKELLCLKAFRIINMEIDSSGQTPSARIKVQVTLAVGNASPMSFTFTMSNVTRGSQSPCWLTDAIILDKL